LWRPPRSLNELPTEEEFLANLSRNEWVIATDSDDAAIFFRFDLVQEEPFDKEKHWDNYDGEYGVLYKIHTYEPGYLEWMKERDPFTGIARSPDRVAIVAEKSTDPEIFRKVVMHEFGHIFGIEHQDSGLMKKGPGLPNCIDQLTLDLFCEDHYCDPNAAPTCKE